MTAQVVLARTLVDEWARAGVEVAALAPGSRSTPLALALAGDARLRLEVFLDERSASFFALGAAKASGRPAVVLCTSGTAAANFHPAVLEARHGRVPLVVCTADRPPELRHTGAGQAIDQIKLYGDAVRWFCEVGVAEDAGPAVSGTYWRSVAARAVAEAMGPPAGPVHLNLAFREPLVPAPAGDSPGTGVAPRSGGRPWTVATRARRVLPDADVRRLAEAVAACPRGLLVAGWGAEVAPDMVERFARAARWPVLADPISGLRTGPHAVSTYDALLRVPEVAARLRPDLVLHLGGPLTGRVATAWLSAVPGRRILVDPDHAWLDPHRTADEVVAADADAVMAALAAELGSSRHGPSPWLDGWLAAEAAARRAVDDFLDADERPSEARVARDVAACLPDGATLVVGSSMPVRDVEAFARPRRGLRLLANRGVNGIDGFVSTVLGVAAVARPVIALCGDLTFLHDTNGLLGGSRRGVDATIVVVDNCGGGIFCFLPQADHAQHFDALFATPHDVDLVEVARLHHLAAVRVTRAAELVPAVQDALAAGGLRVVVVPTDRRANVAHHRSVHQAVARAVATTGTTTVTTPAGDGQYTERSAPGQLPDHRP